MGQWRGGETDDLAYVQYLEPTGDDEVVVLSLMRGKETSFAKMVVHHLPDDFPQEGEVPRMVRLEFEAGEGDRNLAMVHVGYIARDAAGGLAFTTGDPHHLDERLTPIQQVLERLTYELEIRIDGHQLLFPVSEGDRKLIWDCFSIS